MRYLHICFLVFFSLLVNSFNAACQNNERYIKEGDKYSALGDIYNASLNYASYLKEDSLNKEVLYKYAECSRLLNDYTKAKETYSKLYKRDRGISFPECIFWLAMVQKNLGEYDEAKQLFEKYNKRFKKKGTYTALKSQLEADACDWAIKAQKTPANIRVYQLDSIVNSSFSEFAPVERDCTLYFSSSKEVLKKNKKSLPHTSIYQINLAGNLLVPADSVFNAPGVNSGNLSFSKDGTTAYFTRCVSIGPLENRCAIYVTNYSNGKWSAAKRLNDTINQPNYSSTHPCIAQVDSVGTVLYFSSNRKGGEGKMDLWACKLSPSGVFGIPYNLGKLVNSMDNEISPWFENESQTLYFSSEWHKGFGGFDIFKCKRANRIYTSPENLGYPINSSFNDLYFSSNSNNSTSYFSSNREGSYFDTFQSCCNDIYTFKDVPKLIPVKPVTISAVVQTKKDTVLKIVNELKLLVPLTLYFDNDEPDSKTMSVTTAKTYASTFNEYLKLIEPYKSQYTKGLRGEQKADAAAEIEALFTDSIEFGMQQLEKFSELLSRIVPEGEQVKITLKGYCSALASTDYNKNLARRRIACLRNYFANYKNGELTKYIITPEYTPNTKGTIEFTEVEIGEINSNESDDLQNTRLSIYSPQAALARKIKIIAVSSK